ncbi:ferrous iron transport protein B [Larkinella rosea]|uniref:Ferrous iron transport protein B n=1 Tax=Larkinella rosea TaxID=2025312 RepID=A0A3P1C2K4_9BACT|nr:ferrous iron transport protein B [Larkinella rosea]RRB07537.1 ferrous iron transport protein B [Larkinella rosea]
MKSKPVVALVGNPNSGKSSLFNELTGLRQKVGNFPGVTVDKKSGTAFLNETTEMTVVDLPGVYSIYPKSLDEQVVTDILANPQHPDYPDVAIVVVDASNLNRNLLLFTQIQDLGVPVILALNMLDIARQQQVEINAVRLAMQLGVPVVKINARVGEGLDLLKQAIERQIAHPVTASKLFFDPELAMHASGQDMKGLMADVRQHYQLTNNYIALQYLIQHDGFSFLETPQRVKLDDLIEKYQFKELDFQAKETIGRYQHIGDIVKNVVTDSRPLDQSTWSQRIDRFLLHPVWGYAIFATVLLLIFQAIFAWAQPFVDGIDAGVAWLNGTLHESLPEGPLTDLLTDGIIAGVGGVVVFIPQIAFLFLLVSLLEESGYMSRVMVLMDRVMRQFGLNGRSVVPLISGVACAVPALMATRSIGSWRERLITILVTPLMSCSARLPIYTILIALVVPEKTVLGFLNLQGIVMMGLYLLGLSAALLGAYIFKIIIKARERSLFVMELPTYKWPRWNHVGITVWDSVTSFVWQAGRVIVAISIVLWVLASYGPGDALEQAENRARRESANRSAEEIENRVASEKLEASYAGRFGKVLEPAIKPLGYDWKIGIALISSFAAREVFVGTIATIYSIGSVDEENSTTIKQRLATEINPETGGPMYTPAVAFSLLIFYVFAMMCMSTIATVYRETKGWKWPMIQLAYMSVLAYVSAFLVYQLMK